MTIRSIERLNGILCAVTSFSLLFGLGLHSSPAIAAEQPAKAGLRIDYHDETGAVSFIGSDPASPFRLEGIELESLTPQDRSMQYLEHFGEMLGLKSPARELKIMRERIKNDGRTSIRYQQVYLGIPILAGELIVNMDSRGNLLSISGEISPDLSLSIEPSLTREEAKAFALVAVAKGYGQSPSALIATDPELWIFDERLLLSSTRPTELVWRMDVRSQNGNPIDELALINAHTGGISLHFNQIDTTWRLIKPEIRIYEAEPGEGDPTASPTLDMTPTETATDPPTDIPTESPTATPSESPTPFETQTPTPTVNVTPSVSPTNEASLEEVEALNGSNTWYVSTDGDDTNDCLTPATTCASIDGALAKPGFLAGDTINVVSGTYTGTGTYAVTLGLNVTLSGGWDSDFLTQEGFSTIDGESDRRSLKVNSGVSAVVGRFIIQHGTTGIFNFGNLTLDQSTVSDNGSLTAYGSGIDNEGTLTLNNTAVRDNKNNSAGGGIYNNGSLILNNSTVSNNRSTSAGGGIFTQISVELNSSTISDNVASYGGGIWRSSGGVDMENTILAGNTADPSPDCGGGTMTSSGYNIVGNTSNCYLTTTTGDQTDVDPILGDLIGDVDVPRYHPLLAGSPAIDAGNPGGCMGSTGLLDTDQRGVSRVGTCDIGAYEYTTPGAADSIATIRGSSQRARPLDTFEEPLQAAVLDSIGSPVNAATVTFTAPTSGPSGTFEDTDTHTTTAVTNESGVATAADFTANSSTGAYIVSGTVSGVGDQAEFQLTNFAWFVSTSGDDANDCLSSTTTCETINAVFGKPGFEAGDAIFVGSGTYIGTGSEVVLISQDASLHGGWDATFTSQSGTSIIDGENTRRGITLSGGKTADINRFSVQRCANSGIYVSSGATLTLSNSTSSNNSADAGGGILNESGTLNVINSTISGNSATFGGGIHNESGDVFILSSTISNNTGIPFGGGISNGGGGNVSLQNSIVAGNINAGGPDCRGEITSLGYNLVGDVVIPWCTFTPTTGDLTQIDAKLGPLVGSSGHHPLEFDSPAIDAGNPSGCTDHLGDPLTTDQRGMPRVGVCDIGAFEYSTPGEPDSIVAGYGSLQRTPPETEFYFPLQAALLDSNGGLVEDSHVVTFTAPESGASGTFADSGTNTTTAMSDNSGIATSSVLVANAIEGSYIVEASVDGVAIPAEFQLTHFGWYVSTAGDDSNDCQSSLTPCASMNGVLAKGGFLQQDTVLVSIGTYTDSGNEVVYIDTEVRLLGGWDAGFTAQIGTSTIDGEDSRRGVTVNHGATATLERFKFQNGSSSDGGGLYSSGNLTLNDCTVRGNSAGGGGGIFNNQHGSALYERTLIIIDSTVSDNIASSTGGGINNHSGELIIRNSTISGNLADGAGGLKTYGGTVTVNNSTVSNNLATNSFHPGGVLNEEGGSITIQNSIIAGNHAEEKRDCKGEITSSGYNLIGDITGCTFTPATGDLTNTHANITPLQDNGGLTLTHGLAPGSPAIDAGNPATPGSGGDACEAFDQRGVTRPINGDGVGGSRCDIGSYELDPASPPLIPPGDRRTYDAENTTTLPGTFLCDEMVPICTMGSDTHADSAHDYASDTYAFYINQHGRDSIDNAGMDIVSTVHYDSGYANAFWSSSEQQMVYGDAYGFPLGDDVVGHELTHGVTDYESNLFYYYQSGAINESFSDLWGAFVDLTNEDGDDSAGVRWLMGEDISGMGAIRDMENPPVYGDPDKMTSANYYTGSADLGWFGDNGGVHTNSGVNNKAVFLLTDGGSFNGFDVTGLGIEKVAAIYYEVQTGLLTSGADYKDLFNALYQGCLNLVGGVEGITMGDCTEVQDATNAVEMNLEPIPGYNPEAELCPAGGIPIDMFNEDFESGDSNWTFGSVSGTSSWGLASGYATSGTNLLWGNDYYTSSDSYAAMALDVPLPASSQPYLHFQHAFGLEDPDYDGAWLEYSTNSGGTWNDAGHLFDDGVDYTGVINTFYGDGDNTHTGRDAFVGDSHGYVSNRYNLNSLAGEDIRFRWRMSTDSIFSDLGWILDDVRVYICKTGTDLVKNSQFEIFVPSWWRGNLLTTADGPDCDTSVTGACSMRLDGNGDQKQVFFITRLNGNVGDEFTFSLWNKAENSDRPFYAKVVLVYTDATEETFRLIPSKGTHDWTQYQIDFTAAKDYNRIRVFLVYGHDSGTVWFDDISVAVGPMSTEVVKNNLLDAFIPNWWRGNRLTAADGPDCSTTVTDRCSMRLEGNGDQKQVIFITPKNGNAGDNLSFILLNKAAGSDRPFYTKVVLVYTDATQETFRLIPAKGTHEWALYEFNFTAAKNYNRIRVFLVYGAGSGTVWFDDVRLFLE
jgi:Zn-dependent metalloprotease